MIAITITDSKHFGITKVERYSIIGQIFGESSTAGDTDLMKAFIGTGITYNWLDCNNPKENSFDKIMP